MITIPLKSTLDTSNPNRTLGCGYLDPVENIFQNVGLEINSWSSTVVTCKATHLTQFGVEEYTFEVATSDSGGDSTIIDAGNAAYLKDKPAFFSVFAVWVTIGTLIFAVPCLLWGYQKDKRDAINYEFIRNDKHKLHVGLHLDPIFPKAKSKQQGKAKKHKDAEKAYATTKEL